ncbi:Golgi apparatus membrane protein TVP38 [Balamuthia mandrillaris]
MERLRAWTGGQLTRFGLGGQSNQGVGEEGKDAAAANNTVALNADECPICTEKLYHQPPQNETATHHKASSSAASSSASQGEGEEEAAAAATNTPAEGSTTNDNVQVLALPCNPRHVFHLSCIRRWAEVNPTCPLDRSPIPPEALIPRFHRPWNRGRLYASFFAEAVIEGTFYYLWWQHIWKEPSVFLSRLTIDTFSHLIASLLDNQVYGGDENDANRPPQRQLLLQHHHEEEEEEEEDESDLDVSSDEDESEDDGEEEEEEDMRMRNHRRRLRALQRQLSDMEERQQRNDGSNRGNEGQRRQDEEDVAEEEQEQQHDSAHTGVLHRVRPALFSVSEYALNCMLTFCFSSNNFQRTIQFVFRQHLETYSHRLFTKTLHLCNTGYDYATARSIVKVDPFLWLSGTVVGVFVVGGFARSLSDSLSHKASLFLLSSKPWSLVF